MPMEPGSGWRLGGGATGEQASLTSVAIWYDLGNGLDGGGLCVRWDRERRGWGCGSRNEESLVMGERVGGADDTCWLVLDVFTCTFHFQITRHMGEEGLCP